MRRRPLPLAVVLTVVALTTSCSSGDGASPATTTVATTVATTSGVPTALEFSAPTVGGGELDARTYAGRNLALWFWAPY